MEEQTNLFDEPEHGAARWDDPDTSQEAAEAVNATRLEQIFVATLAKHLSGLTSEQVATLSGVKLNSISPRTAPLVRKGKIHDSGLRRDKRIVWKLGPSKLQYPD